MFELSLSGAAEVLTRLNETPDALRAALAQKIELLADGLYRQVVDVNLDGGVLNARSGRLRNSIEVATTGEGAKLGAEIFSNGDAPYAAILERGGKTAAHDILPDKARVLAFALGGKQVFARAVQHPGSSFEARGYLSGALDASRENISAGLRETVAAVATSLGART